MFRLQAALTAFSLCLVAGGAQAAPSANADTFKDWAVVCDNLHDCVADGFSTDELEKPAILQLTRGGAAAAATRVLIQLLDEDAAKAAQGKALSLAVDDKPVLIAKAGADGSARLSDAEAAKLLAAARNGSALTISVEDNPVGVVSLAGMAAALRRVDDQQGRVGTVTALVAKGPKPASAVPPQPALPVVRRGPAVAQTGLPAKPSASVKALSAKNECDVENGDSGLKPDAYRLSADVLLWQIPCGAGAYNYTSLMVVTDGRGGAARLAPGLGDGLQVNVGYDPKTRILSAYGKGRGIGDCGDSSEWAWTGTAFETTAEAVMPLCRGQSDWPVSYRAKVE